MEDREKYDAYHESGHCLIAMLFDDELDIKRVTLDKESLKKIDPSYNGGLEFGWKRKPLATDFNAADKLALISLAGICTATIYIKGQKYIEDNLYKFPSDSSHLSTIDADVDYETAKGIIAQLAECFSLEPLKIQWNMFFFLFRFLKKNEVWNCITQLSNKLLEKENKTLYYSEIVQIFDDCHYSKYIEENKTNLLSTRYPLDNFKLMFFGFV
jgi:hypothetical protein